MIWYGRATYYRLGIDFAQFLYECTSCSSFFFNPRTRTKNIEKKFTKKKLKKLMIKKVSSVVEKHRQPTTCLHFCDYMGHQTNQGDIYTQHDTRLTLMLFFRQHSTMLYNVNRVLMVFFFSLLCPHQRSRRHWMTMSRDGIWRKCHYIVEH